MSKRYQTCLGVILGAVLVLVLSACAPEMIPPPDLTPVAPSPELEQPAEPVEILPGSWITPGIEILPRDTPIPGAPELPDRPIDPRGDTLQVFEPVRAYIANTLGISLEEVVLESSEEVEWPDGCLGVSAPGMMCPMMVTPGYLAFFETPHGRIEAHLDKSGRHFRIIPSLGLEGGGSPARLTGTPGASGIRGQSLLTHACPGPVSADKPCPDQPLQATISVLGPNGEVVTWFQTDSEGFFQVELPPGKYTLHPESPGKLPHGIDQQVMVLEGQYLEIQVTYESGIR